MDLAERLGSFLGQVCTGTPERIEMGLYGELQELDAKPILSAAVTGVLRAAPGPGVTYVNARAVAAERGIEVVESTSSAQVGFANLMVLRLKTSACDFSVAGTIFGRATSAWWTWTAWRWTPSPRGTCCSSRTTTRRAWWATWGHCWGTRSINIARMTVGRKPGSGRAVMLIEVDNEVPPEVVAEVGRVAGVREARALKLQ